jgi:hypothetical protein
LAAILYRQPEQEFDEILSALKPLPVCRSPAKRVDNLAKLFDAAGQVGIGHSEAWKIVERNPVRLEIWIVGFDQSGQEKYDPEIGWLRSTLM